MERKLLRYFLYVIMAFGLVGAYTEADPRQEHRGDPTPWLIATVIAAAGLAASARIPVEPPKPPPLPKG